MANVWRQRGLGAFLFALMRRRLLGRAAMRHASNGSSGDGPLLVSAMGCPHKGPSQKFAVRGLIMTSVSTIDGSHRQRLVGRCSNIGVEENQP